MGAGPIGASILVLIVSDASIFARTSPSPALGMRECRRAQSHGASPRGAGALTSDFIMCNHLSGQFSSGRKGRLGLGLSALLFVVACSRAEPERPRPDVLFLVIDTLRADRLGAYGNERGLSPVIDRLAAEGSLFTGASSQAPWTLLSMSSMLTSQYPTEQFERPSESRTTIAESFREAGYSTIGVAANSLLDPGTGFERGFDVYVGRETENGKRKFPGIFTAATSWIEDSIAAALKRDENGERKPLFLYVHPVDPHAPYREQASFLKELPVDAAPPIEPAGWQEQTIEEYGLVPPEDDADWAKALRGIRRQRNAYDHEVRTTDEALGELLEKLELLGARDNLLIVIASDHGEELWENVVGTTRKRLKGLEPKTLFFQSHGYSLAEQALRTPIILSGPGVPQGKVFSEPVENVDLFPTMVSLCGLRKPEDLHGEDLTRLMRGKIASDEWRKETFSYVAHCYCMRDEVAGLKLILPTPYGIKLDLAKPQLYDLNKDPLERHNIIDERPDDVSRLTLRMQEYLKRYDAEVSWAEDAEAATLRRRLQENGYAGMLIGDEEDEN